MQLASQSGQQWCVAGTAYDGQWRGHGAGLGAMLAIDAIIAIIAVWWHALQRYGTRQAQRIGQAAADGGVGESQISVGRRHGAFTLEIAKRKASM
jgi:hypothetical protein